MGQALGAKCGTRDSEVKDGVPTRTSTLKRRDDSAP